MPKPQKTAVGGNPTNGSVVEHMAGSQTSAGSPAGDGQATGIDLYHGLRLTSDKWQRDPTQASVWYNGYAGLSRNLAALLKAKGYTIEILKNSIALSYNGMRLKTAKLPFFQNEQGVREFLMKQDDLIFDVERVELMNKATMDGLLTFLEEESGAPAEEPVEVEAQPVEETAQTPN